MAKNVAEALQDEIERVARKQERYKQYALECGPRANFAPLLAMMQMSLENGKAAAASGDVVAIIRAYEDLRGFDED